MQVLQVFGGPPHLGWPPGRSRTVSAGALEANGARLYLPLLRLGAHPEHLVALAGREAAVRWHRQRQDDAPPQVRRTSVKSEFAGLSPDAVELELRSAPARRATRSARLSR